MAGDLARDDAFISYAREDEDVAHAIQIGLQRYARPWYRLQALRVFRDRTALRPGDGLSDALRERLRRSRWFLLVVSPEAAQSEWVRKEIRWWREDHPGPESPVHNLVVICTSGDIKNAGDELDWTRTTALPREDLGGAWRAVPVWVPLLRRPAGLRYVDIVPDALGAWRARFGRRAAHSRQQPCRLIANSRRHDRHRPVRPRRANSRQARHRPAAMLPAQARQSLQLPTVHDVFAQRAHRLDHSRATGRRQSVQVPPPARRRCLHRRQVPARVGRCSPQIAQSTSTVRACR